MHWFGHFLSAWLPTMCLSLSGLGYVYLSADLRRKGCKQDANQSKIQKDFKIFLPNRTRCNANDQRRRREGKLHTLGL
ncbi:hypothetical protein E1A91_D05G445600v1 [Gossypium mustelinum]|uniref:Secreted protein n=1 Tax=Gossypium mustelinum TaxID=34275 RepID=A0A5D2V7T1_GOSMU|nr:hypothetical protein E1A91_D05G445600v1 [Gossypium mustelinum]